MRHPSGVAVVTSVNRPARPTASIRQRTSATAASAPRVFTSTSDMATCCALEAPGIVEAIPCRIASRPLSPVGVEVEATRV